MGLICKPSSALPVPEEANSLHNKNDRGIVAKETEQQKTGRCVKIRFDLFCTALLLHAPVGVSRQNQALLCRVRRKVKMCPRMCACVGHEQ